MTTTWSSTDISWRQPTTAARERCQPRRCAGGSPCSGAPAGCCSDLAPMLAWEGCEGEHVRPRLGEQRCRLREALLELVHHSSVLLPDRVLVGLGQDRANQGGDQRLRRLG